MNPSTNSTSATPLREHSSQRRSQLMMTLAPTQFEELLISHICRRLELNDGKLDELMNGVTKAKNSSSSIKASLRRIASPFQVMKNATTTTPSPSSCEVSGRVVCAVSRLLVSLSSASELQVEGLFRKSGNCARVKDLKQRVLEQDGGVDLTLYTAHDRATAVKHFLGEMPEPLLLARHLEAFRQCTALQSNGVESSQQRCLRVMQLLMLHLPPNNQLVLRRLLSLLRCVAGEAANRMDSGGLATLFAPHLLCSKQLQADPVLFNSALNPATAAVKFMIDNCTQLFQIPVEFSRDVNLFLRTECRFSGGGGNADSGAGTPVRRETSAVFSPSVTYSARSDDTDSHDTTAAELAKLQEHIRSMPEAEKRKLSRQLNDVTVMRGKMEAAAAAGGGGGTPNGENTPLKYRHASGGTPRNHARSKSLGSSIKKRLPMFRGKSKHPASILDLGGSLTAVNIDFEDGTPSSASPMLLQYHHQPPTPTPSSSTSRTSTKKRTAETPPPPQSPAILQTNPPPMNDDDDDVTPPKIAHKEPDPIILSQTTNQSPGGNVKTRKLGVAAVASPLPQTENERDFVMALGCQEKMVATGGRVLSPVQPTSGLSWSSRSTIAGAKASPQKWCGRGAQEQRCLKSSSVPQPLGMETAL